MDYVQYTLVADGSSDRALIPIINWVLRESGGIDVPNGKWADLRRTRKPSDLSERLKLAVEFYPCDILFVHRDAEKASSDARYQEVEKAVAKAFPGALCRPTVCIVPIRMQEAWLLFDEGAIREAAGNPNGDQFLDLPSAKSIEGLPDPKGILHRVLRLASGLQKRRLKSFNAAEAAAFVPEYVKDFSPLRELNAFLRFEEDVKRLGAIGWKAGGML